LWVVLFVVRLLRSKFSNINMGKWKYAPFLLVFEMDICLIPCSTACECITVLVIMRWSQAPISYFSLVEITSLNQRTVTAQLFIFYLVLI
jgi:hypothetical protein